jgi:hypothetical protein
MSVIPTDHVHEPLRFGVSNTRVDVLDTPLVCPTHQNATIRLITSGRDLITSGRDLIVTGRDEVVTGRDEVRVRPVRMGSWSNRWTGIVRYPH